MFSVCNSQSKQRLILLAAIVSSLLLYEYLYFGGTRANKLADVISPSFNKVLTAFDRFRKPNEDSSNIPRKNETSKHPFKILVWTKWYNTIVTHETWAANTECGKDFIITSNKSELHDADIIIFQYVDLLRENYAPTDISWWPHPRKENVPWVLALQEAPMNVKPLKWMMFDKVFNWTWSYYTTSEIRPVFSEMYQSHEKPDDKWIYGSNFSSEFLRNKSKQVAWLVSNCRIQPSKRNELVSQLKRHGVQVDIFGKCGKNSSCPAGDDCFKDLGEKYKFYFAAENSLCVDYATEKIHHGLRHGMVPIVYGLGNYKTIAPPSSYINVMDFGSVVELANYIKSLDKSPEKYFRYFEWRKEYNVDLDNSYFSNHQCTIYRRMKRLVTALKEKNETNSRHVFDDVDLKLWFRTFQDHKLNRTCYSCLRNFEVSVRKPILNKRLCREHG